MVKPGFRTIQLLDTSDRATQDNDDGDDVDSNSLKVLFSQWPGEPKNGSRSVVSSIEEVKIEGKALKLLNLISASQWLIKS